MSDTALELAPMQLGYPRTELRRKLVDAVLRGEKTATAGLRSDYAPHTEERLPEAGDRCVLLGYDGEPVAVVETTEVRVVRVDDVDLAFARDEGEGFESVADWRRAHEEFWSDQELDDDTLVVAERFRIVARLESTDAPKEPTCGQGLADQGRVPTKLAQLLAAVAENLELHTGALDVSDEHSKREHDVYRKLVDQHRRLSAQLEAMGAEMAASRELPMGPHDEQALAAPKIVEAFEAYVRIEEELSALLLERVEHNRRLLAEMGRAAAS
jgi:uncharacterized protein YhfF